LPPTFVFSATIISFSIRTWLGFDLGFIDWAEARQNKQWANHKE
jgi:hypothetical protein